MNAFHQQLGQRVRDIRKREGLTQKELAAKTNITRSYVAQIERGQRPRLSVEVVFRLAQGLRCSMNDLVGDPIRPRRRSAKR